MEGERIITLQLKLTRKHFLAMLAAFFLCWHPKPLGSETLTLTTYYPAPYGGYANLLTTGRTLLARDSTSPSSDTNFVGIGLNNPQVKLHVNTISGLDEVARFATAGTNGYIRVDGASNQAALYDNSVGSYSNNDFYLKTNQAERVRIDTSGQVGIGPSPTTWSPSEYLTVKNGNIQIDQGNLKFGSPAAVVGSGFIAGLCKTQSYSFGGTQSCPSGYERIVAVYGNSCDSGAAVLVNGGDMHISSNWIPHQEPNCHGTMLCCNIKDF